MRPSTPHTRRPAASLSPAATRVLAHPRIELPPAARADVGSGQVHTSVLSAMLRLAETYRIGVSVVRQGIRSTCSAHPAQRPSAAVGRSTPGGSTERRWSAPINKNRIPGCTYTEPGIGSVGMTEAQARAAGYKVKVGKFPFAGDSRATILGQHDGFIKVVADEKYGEILGVHIIGPEGFELIARSGGGHGSRSHSGRHDADHSRASHAVRSGGRGIQRGLRSLDQCVSCCACGNSAACGYGERAGVAAANWWPQRKQGLSADQLLLLEHPHVITMGRNGHMENLLASDEVLDRAGISFLSRPTAAAMSPITGRARLVGYPISICASGSATSARTCAAIEQVLIDTLAELRHRGRARFRD